MQTPQHGTASTRIRVPATTFSPCSIDPRSKRHGKPIVLCMCLYGGGTLQKAETPSRTSYTVCDTLAAPYIVYQKNCSLSRRVSMTRHGVMTEERRCRWVKRYLTMMVFPTQATMHASQITSKNENAQSYTESSTPSRKTQKPCAPS